MKKRILSCVFVVLFLLPVLLVPVSAVSDEYSFSCGGIQSEYVTFVYHRTLPVGYYMFQLFYDDIFLSCSVDPFYVSGVYDDVFLGFPVEYVTILCRDLVHQISDTLPVLFGREADVSFIIVPNVFFLESSDSEYLTLRLYKPDGSYLLTGLGGVGSSILSFVLELVVTIVQRPFLLVTVGIFFVGGCIALFGRVLKRS